MARTPRRKRDDTEVYDGPFHVDEARSLNELHGWSGTSSGLRTGLVERMDHACATPIRDLTADQLHTLLAQGIDPHFLIAIALRHVALPPGRYETRALLLWMLARDELWARYPFLLAELATRLADERTALAEDSDLRSSVDVFLERHWLAWVTIPAHERDLAALLLALARDGKPPRTPLSELWTRCESPCSLLALHAELADPQTFARIGCAVVRLGIPHAVGDDPRPEAALRASEQRLLDGTESPAAHRDIIAYLEEAEVFEQPANAALGSAALTVIAISHTSSTSAAEAVIHACDDIANLVPPAAVVAVIKHALACPSLAALTALAASETAPRWLWSLPVSRFARSR